MLGLTMLTDPNLPKFDPPIWLTREGGRDGPPKTVGFKVSAECMLTKTDFSNMLDLQRRGKHLTRIWAL